MAAFYYLVPDNEKPSWGIGVIYHHVKALVELGYDACVLHQNSSFTLPWLSMDVPVRYADEPAMKSLNADDVLVVPEVMAAHPFAAKCKARKILFVQNSGYIFESLPVDAGHRDLGYSAVMVIMPHMVDVVERFIGLPVFMVQPMVADYFFSGQINMKRSRTIVMYPKFSQIDFAIVNNLLRRKLGSNRLMKAVGIHWRIKLLEGLSHRQVAGVFDDAGFFVSLNTFEALNTSVVEAMARGCIVFCYEGVGPRDFLRDGVNAFVFPNNEAYRLVDKMYDVLDNPEKYREQLAGMRNNALVTARQYTYANMKEELKANIPNLMGGKQQ